MASAHDDLPHPVPHFAYLRWKENYFFTINDPVRKIFGVSHLNFEPAFDRARFSCNLSIEGKLYQYGNETGFPEDFAYSRMLTDGVLEIRIDPAISRFDLILNNNELDVALQFNQRMPAFDFSRCKYAAPDIPSHKEAMTLGMNLPFEHMQQAMTVTGTVYIKAEAKSLELDGYGYRDHSWCVRSDNLVLNHSFAGHNFPGTAFGVMTIEMKSRPGLIAKEGYVVDKDGARAFQSIDLELVGEGPDDLPAKVIYRLTDVFGENYVIESDVAGRLGHVPLVAEKSPGAPVYRVAENFCSSRLAGCDQPGFSIVELGNSL
jgi:hypothetical protein